MVSTVGSFSSFKIQPLPRRQFKHLLRGEARRHPVENVTSVIT